MKNFSVVIYMLTHHTYGLLPENNYNYYMKQTISDKHEGEDSNNDQA